MRKKRYSIRLINKGFLIFFLFLLTSPGNARVKTIGTPRIQNYPRAVYKAGTQNWGISQDNNGFIYFANNDGVLRFDGIHWDLIPASPNSPVRSVFADSANNVFVGLINDFGVITQNDPEPPVFQSLRHLLPPGTADFDDIWRIHNTPRGIAFQCYAYLFILQNGEIEVVRPQNKFHFSFSLGDKLLLHEQPTGLYEYTASGNMIKLPWSGSLGEKEICTVMDAGNGELIIGTTGSGLYRVQNETLEKWDTPASHLVEQNKLYSATRLADGNFAFGTILNGLVIADRQGSIIQEISRKQGLQNNTLLSLFADKSENLWLGLDNGIDYVEINSPISFITDFERRGTGYACRIFNGNLYVGTNQGLFVRPFDKYPNNNAPFELVKNTGGQVWSLHVFDNELLCGHNLGTFRIEGREAFPVSREEGAWKYIRLKNHPGYLLGGHYSGLILLKKEKNGWEFFRKLEGFNESSRYIEEDEEGVIWISHGGKGVFRVILEDDLEKIKNYNLFTAAHELPSSESNILFKFNEKVYISTIAGIFHFDAKSELFKADEDMNRFFDPEGRIKTLKTDDAGNIWYIAENESGVMRLNEDLTYTKITAPFKQLEDMYVNEFEFIYPSSEMDAFIGIDQGFAHYSAEFQRSYSNPFRSYITSVELPYIDSSLFFSQQNPEMKFEFPFRKNTFRFHYTAPFFKNPGELEFSFFLENYSEAWSDWTSENLKEFTNLREGDYTFRLKARNIYGVESETSSFAFSVLPPWHRSKLALYTYLGIIIFLILLTIKLIQHRMELTRKKEKQKHQLELRQKEELFQHQTVVAEKEIIRLRNEKLRNEMIHRDKELANQTMGIIEKNKFLMKLKEELQRIQKSTEDGQVKTKMAILNRKINREIDNKQQSLLFETYFGEVHNDFFERLKEKYPQLSPREMRLSAYIRMNLTSKEIAALFNISDRGVEISRYRLRKKMGLSREINLSTFLSNI